MTYKYSHLELSLITALVVITGCSKQQATTPSATDTTPKAPASAVSSEFRTSAVPKPADVQSAISNAASTSAALVPATNVATDKGHQGSPSQTPAGLATNTLTGLKTTLQTTLQTQQVALTQAAISQFQALAAGATNRALNALATTYQVASTATNQVQALLDKARLLTSNQKYQEALNTVSQLYATKLTPEQKQKADDLKNQIQTALTQKASSEAGSVLGTLIGGKKE